VSGFLGITGIGGSSLKTDRSNELKGFGDLGQVFNFGMGTAQGALGGANNYWQKLLTGNRAQMEQAEAPEINAVQAGADASKRQLATVGTARGGGVGAGSQQLDTNTRAAIDNSLFAARPAAASAEAQIGENTLGTAAGTAGTLTGLASQSRQVSNELNPGNQLLADITKLIGAAAGGHGGSGGDGGGSEAAA
jgi:hypothetical protein